MTGLHTKFMMAVTSGEQRDTGARTEESKSIQQFFSVFYLLYSDNKKYYQLCAMETRYIILCTLSYILISQKEYLLILF